MFIEMNIKIRKLITSHWIHHPRPDIGYLYIKSENGGRSLIQQELNYKTTTLRLKEYFRKLKTKDKIWWLRTIEEKYVFLTDMSMSTDDKENDKISKCKYLEI